MAGLYHFIRLFLPSSSVQMREMTSGFSLMYFSPLTLILTLYKVISINLPKKDTIKFVQTDHGRTVEAGGKISIPSTPDYAVTFYSLIVSCIVVLVCIITHTFNLGKMPGFITCKSFITVSSRMGAEPDRKSLPRVTAAISV